MNSKVISMVICSRGFKEFIFKILIKSQLLCNLLTPHLICCFFSLQLDAFSCPDVTAKLKAVKAQLAEAQQQIGKSVISLEF